MFKDRFKNYLRDNHILGVFDLFAADPDRNLNVRRRFRFGESPENVKRKEDGALFAGEADDHSLHAMTYRCTFQGAQCTMMYLFKKNRLYALVLESAPQEKGSATEEKLLASYLEDAEKYIGKAPDRTGETHEQFRDGSVWEFTDGTVQICRRDVNASACAVDLIVQEKT